MKNALLYTVNNNKPYVDKTINSIDSFFHFNPELKESVEVVVIVDDKSIDMRGLASGIKCTLVDKMVFDYSSLEYANRRAPLTTMYRLEAFANPIFDDFDVLLSLDGDTEFRKPCPELFQEPTEPIVGLVPERKSEMEWHMNEIGGAMTYTNYFNMGFMLLTPKLIGRHMRIEMFLKLLSLVNRFPQFYLPDQDSISLTVTQEPYCKMLKLYDTIYNYHEYAFNNEQVDLNDVVMRHYVCGKEYDLKYISQEGCGGEPR